MEMVFRQDGIIVRLKTQYMLLEISNDWTPSQSYLMQWIMMVGNGTSDAGQ